MGVFGEVEPTQSDLAVARELVDAGWHMVSRRHRTVARLPEGKTGLECLTGVLNTRWTAEMGEGPAGDMFLRCYTERDTHRWRDLSQGEFVAFRRVGGTTYSMAFARKAAPARASSNVGQSVVPPMMLLTPNAHSSGNGGRGEQALP